MARFSPAIVNFNGGELSPLMDGRGDTDKYQAGLTLCENFLLTSQGPLTKRPGTLFCHEVHDSTYASTPYPFRYSSSEGHCLEFAADRIRFISNGSLITETSQSVTVVSGLTLTCAAHGYNAGDQVILSGFGSDLLGRRVFTIDSVTTNDFTLASGPTLTGTGTVERVYHLAHSFDAADVPYLRMTQSADVVFIAHPDYVPKVLSRYGETNWTLTDYAFRDGPYDSVVTGGVTLTPSGTSGSITLTASGTTGINRDDGFQATDVGRLIRLKDPSTNNWIWAEITARSSTTVVTATIKSAALNGTGAINTFRLGLYSDTTGYPSAVEFHEDRLVFAGGNEFPHNVCFSETGDYYTHSPTELDGTVTDSNGINVKVNARDGDSILWLANDQNGLLIGSASDESIITASKSGEALSPDNISIVTATTHGSSAIVPVKADYATLFVQRGRTVVREMAFVSDIGGYSAPKMTVTANHITKSGLVDAAFQELPYPIYWAPRADGEVAAMTYEREANVIGWHRHLFENALVEKVLVVPSATPRQEDVYLFVKREINGETVRYIELLESPWSVESTKEAACFADCSVLYDGTETDEITGLWWLEGETVSVLVDGADHPDVEVTDGTVALERSGTKVRVGYRIVSRMRTMPILGGSEEGTGRGKLKRLNDVVLQLWDSQGGRVKSGPPESASFESIPRLFYGQNYGEAPDLISGEVKVQASEGYNSLGLVEVEHAELLPFNLIAIFPRVTVQDGG